MELFIPAKRPKGLFITITNNHIFVSTELSRAMNSSEYIQVYLDEHEMMFVPCSADAPGAIKLNHVGHNGSNAKAFYRKTLQWTLKRKLGIDPTDHHQPLFKLSFEATKTKDGWLFDLAKPTNINK